MHQELEYEIQGLEVSKYSVSKAMWLLKNSF